MQVVKTPTMYHVSRINQTHTMAHTNHQTTITISMTVKTKYPASTLIITVQKKVMMQMKMITPLRTV